MYIACALHTRLLSLAHVESMSQFTYLQIVRFHLYSTQAAPVQSPYCKLIRALQKVLSPSGCVSPSGYWAGRGCMLCAQPAGLGLPCTGNLADRPNNPTPGPTQVGYWPDPSRGLLITQPCVTLTAHYARGVR